MKIFTKEELIKLLKDITKMGWIEGGRPGNHGSVGNTLEDLLGIEENNLPIPNAAEWELKAQRKNTSSLVTLFHSEPSPRALKFVPQILLPNYGWPHKEKGEKYGDDEMSFRQTINAVNPSDRGFSVQIDRMERKILISFDASKVDKRHQEWLSSVKQKIGGSQLEPQPYWGFDDLEHKIGTKLLNCFFVLADSKKDEGKEFFKYEKVLICKKFEFEKFLLALEKGLILVDFDARTGHNHGTKFRMKPICLPDLYSEVKEI